MIKSHEGVIIVVGAMRSEAQVGKVVTKSGKGIWEDASVQVGGPLGCPEHW